MFVREGFRVRARIISCSCTNNFVFVQELFLGGAAVAASADKQSHGHGTRARSDAGAASLTWACWIGLIGETLAMAGVHAATRP